MSSFDAIGLANHAVVLANSPKAPRCKGWDAKDPEGCWTHDARRHGPIDYCHGFRLFEEYGDAVKYAEGLDTPFLLGFDQMAQRWAVEPLDGNYG